MYLDLHIRPEHLFNEKVSQMLELISLLLPDDIALALSRFLDLSAEHGATTSPSGVQTTSIHLTHIPPTQ